MASRPLLGRTLEKSGFGPVMRHLRTGWHGGLVLAYGRIGDPAGCALSRTRHSATQDELDAQLGYLRGNFAIVDCDEGLRGAYVTGGRSVAVSFDGGYADQYELALPVLLAHEIPATFFIPTGFVDRPRVPWWDELAGIVRRTDRPTLTLPGGGRLTVAGDREAAIADLQRAAGEVPSEQVDDFVGGVARAADVPRCTPAEARGLWMSWEQVRELRDRGMQIGGHTVNLPVLDRCTPGERRAEIEGGLARLAEQTGSRPSVFAHPREQSGPPGPGTAGVLREAGVTHAFSSYGYRPSRRVRDPFDLSRVAISPADSGAGFRAATTLPRLIVPPGLASPPPAAPIRAGGGRKPIRPAGGHEPIRPAGGHEPIPPGEELGPIPPAGGQDQLAGDRPGPTGHGGSAAAEAAEGAAWASNLRRGLAWSAATFIGSKALTFVAVLILARILVPADFGLLAGVLTFLALIELGSDLGMKASVIYEQESGVTDRVQTAFTLNLAVAGALTVAGVLASPLVAGVFGAQAHTGLFRLASLNLLLTGLGNTHDALLLRDMSFSRRIRPQVIRELTRGVVAIALAVAGFGAASLVIGHLAGTAAWCAIQWRLSPLRPDFTLDRRFALSMISYGGQSAALEVLAVFATRIDVVVIGSALGTAALGVYSIAYRFPDILIGSVAYTVTVVAFPALTRRRDQDRGGLALGTLQLLRFQGLYAFPVAAAVAVLSSPLVVVLFGERWRAATPVMVAVALAAAVNTSTFALGDLLKAVGRQGFIVALNLIDIPLLILGTLFAARHGGITAVAWTIFGVTLGFGVALTGAARRALGVTWPTIGRPFLPGLATAVGVALAGGAVRLAYPADSLVELFAGGVACAVGGLVALRVLAKDTFVDLRRQVDDLIPAGRRGAPGPADPVAVEPVIRPDPVTPAPATASGDLAPPVGSAPVSDQRHGPPSGWVPGPERRHDAPVGSAPVPDQRDDAPPQLAREAGDRVSVVLAAAEAEAAALDRGADRLCAQRTEAAADARRIVGVARAACDVAAAALENLAAETRGLEASAAALLEEVSTPLARATGEPPGGLGDAGAAVAPEIAPVVAAAEVQARALVTRAAGDAATLRRDALVDVAQLVSTARQLTKSTRELAGRLPRLAAATSELEKSVLASEGASPPSAATPGPLEVGPTPGVLPGSDPELPDDGLAERARAVPEVRPPEPRLDGGLPLAAAVNGGGDDGLRAAATHVALTMAVSGVSRDGVAVHLRNTLHLDDPGPVLDHVFGPLAPAIRPRRPMPGRPSSG